MAASAFHGQAAAAWNRRARSRLDRHEWETEWQGLEPLVADSPARALPELDELVRRMLGHGNPVDEEHEFAAPEAEVVKEFLEACRVTRRVDAGESVDPGDVGGGGCYRNVYDYLTSATSPSAIGAAAELPRLREKVRPASSPRRS